MKLENYSHFGGRQVETAALHNTLAYLGVVAPDTAKPFTEPLLFGIGGGIGVGYFVYQMPEEPSLFLATRITTKESGEPGFIGGICERLGIPFELQTSTSAAAAAKKLQAALDGGTPVIAWVDTRVLPYFGTPGGYHTLVVYGLDDEAAHIADRTIEPVTLSPDALAAARASGEVNKYQSLLVRAPAEPITIEQVQQAVRDGISASTDQLQNGFGPANVRSSFGLAALEKWAGYLVDPKDKRGWEKMIPTGAGLFNALLTLYDHIENRGLGGPAFRDLYAEFLSDAAVLIAKPDLSWAADRYRQSALAWGELGEELLPDDVPLLLEARHLADRRRRVSENEGAAAAADLAEINNRLAEIKLEVAEDPALNGEGKTNLLARIAERVRAVHAAESEALAAALEAMREA